MQTEPPGISLLLVDDHALVRMGLAVLLEMEPDFKVVGEAGDGAQALELFARLNPDVTLLDVRMPHMDGIETLKQLIQKWPEARVVMLTTSDLEDEIDRAIRAGACGYLLKKVTREELVKAVRQVHSGEACIPDEVAKQLAANRNAPRLSEREREVLAMLPRGLTNPDIAKALGISLNTTKTHLRTIFSKLDVVDRSEAINVAVQRGILHLNEQ
ncbi:MAG TPA: response regulator transcription factor [Verrucomicrobiae bacterium]|jgi:two-component system NarL family response regulator|nr:response regulator transcription factor [Verrucomicrobiae bacterium]